MIGNYINNINSMMPNIGFLIYKHLGEFGAIKLDKIVNIDWHTVNGFLKLNINNIGVYEIDLKNINKKVFISEFKLKVLQRILLHIGTSINENIYMDDIIKELIEI